MRCSDSPGGKTALTEKITAKYNEKIQMGRPDDYHNPDTRLHSFLLDKDNRVVLTGNPIGNEPLWELYKEQIRELINR